jgi:hypothetical protein
MTRTPINHRFIFQGKYIFFFGRVIDMANLCLYNQTYQNKLMNLHIFSLITMILS